MPTPAAATKLAEIKHELQAGLATLVHKEVHSLANASAPDQGQDARIQKLEAGLTEVRLQNNKFEEWFQTFGMQMQQQASQVVEVQQAVAAQKSDLGTLRSEVTTSITQAVSSFRTEMSQQFAAQTASLEAMLVKKQRSE